MTTLLTDIAPARLTPEKAQIIAAELNAGELDDWTYEVVTVALVETETYCLVGAYDQVGEFVDYIPDWNAS